MQWNMATSLKRSLTKLATSKVRRTRPARPGLEPLDGRQLLSTVGPALPGPIPPSSSSLVYTGANGHLVYTADKMGNQIPDFSAVGYRSGLVPIPGTMGTSPVPVKAVVAPASGDAGARIQAAINMVSKLPLDRNGFRGAVLLLPGEYDISDHIEIDASGVVLRGSGMGAGGTVLRATGTALRYPDGLVQIKGVVPSSVNLDGSAAPPQVPGTEQGITDAYVPVGATSFHVASAAGFHVGDQVIVHRPSTAAWIHAIGEDAFGAASWTPGSKDLDSDRVITAIRGNVITVDAPITNALETRFGASLTAGGPVYAGSIYKYSFPGRINNVGVEDLSGISDFTSPTDEAHAWTFISTVAVQNAWVRDITATHFAFSAVSVEKTSKWVTVEHAYNLAPISQITGGRRDSFFVGGQLTLVQDAHAQGGRHDFITDSIVPGPNVFFNDTATGSFDETGPHQRWSTGILFDNVTVHADPSATSKGAGAINVRNRGLDSSGSLQGWAGANVVIWNSTADSIEVDQPPTAQNWAIGAIAGKYSGNGFFESNGRHVQPTSLYLAQLKDRLSR
jgi:hypothetical protein